MYPSGICIAAEIWFNVNVITTNLIPPMTITTRANEKIVD
ncbi:hypothetical protein ASZ90_004952 [hydrocarbon metagenome]|uniref:Uncharacterized protein n=1 Tax=hydrocarbon metagenome TaxID=938273 RepID=A0A0W8FWL9_9ZZZZ